VDFLNDRANTISVASIIILAADNIDRDENQNRKQYGILFKKSTEGLWKMNRDENIN